MGFTPFLNLIIEHFYVAFSGLCAAILLVFYVVLRTRLKEPRQYELRLKLYHIRDSLRMEIARGRLKENSVIYQHYDNLINEVVKNAEKWTIVNVANAIAKHGKEFGDKKRHTKKLFQMIEKADPEVQKLIRAFYLEMSVLLVRQSRATFIIGSVLLLGYELFKMPTRSNRLPPVLKQAKFKHEADYLASQLCPA